MVTLTLRSLALSASIRAGKKEVSEEELIQVSRSLTPTLLSWNPLSVSY